jgi:hypothetical protein
VFPIQNEIWCILLPFFKKVQDIENVVESLKCYYIIYLKELNMFTDVWAQLLVTTSELVSFFLDSINCRCALYAMSLQLFYSLSCWGPIFWFLLFFTFIFLSPAPHPPTTHTWRENGGGKSYGVIKDWPDFSHARVFVYCRHSVLNELLRQAGPARHIVSSAEPSIGSIIIISLYDVYYRHTHSSPWIAAAHRSMAATDEQHPRASFFLYTRNNPIQPGSSIMSAISCLCVCLSFFLDFRH